MSRLVFTSRSQIILMIGDEGVLFVPHNVSGENEIFFVAEKDQAGIEEILAALKRNPRVPLVLFADNLAQDFRRETIPRLNPLDRPKLIERRLRQAFPQAALTASINCRHDRTQALLVGLHSDGPVFEWLRRIKEQSRHVPHIALLPIECVDIVLRLLPEAAEGWALLLSRQRTGGFRQIVTHNGEMIFTRLTPPLPLSASANEIVEAVARDIKASLGYLGRLGLTDPAELHAALLMPEAMHRALRVLVLPVHSMRLLSPHQAAWELDPSLKLEKNEAYSDLLYARWLAHKRKPRLPLMPPDLKRTRWTATIREWGWRAAAASLFIAVIMTGLQAGDLVSTLFTVRQETVELAALKKKLTEEQATAAPITEPLGRLRQAIERRRIFSEPTPMPWTVLRMLNTGLGSDAKLVKLEWHSDGEKPSDEAMQINVRFSEHSLLSVAERESAAARFQKLTQDVVRAMPGYEVNLTHYPFPALPEETLSNEGSSKGNALENNTAQLNIRNREP